ncbi:conjugal transfer ATP-binding protein TraC [Novosphingobium chloroacetimidivorans]|uniref:Conjugal transfer ATP-binding protein TraC n=1 Tax=Novosphingobium chloroacetimidivorans TaxID=1428314 RepID=A0A7W7KD23_9SPHN|nr:type IV secretion system protein TraC [Novosphingobium chloroacetimidivorans]MBB4860531.1 conjugal transfer ATP-binding protein TraC [Novosphingobium chloroacetimidivorans]
MADIIRRMVELVTGDTSKPEAHSKAPEVPMLAHYLGYRAFDPKRDLFYLTRSKGFILELAPLIGADERIGDILNTVFSDILTSGTHYTVTSWPSPRVSEKLEGWVLPRVRAGGVFEKLARYRLDLLRNGAWATLATDGPFHLRNFRVIFSVGVPDSSGASLDDLTTMRQSLIAALDSINVPARVLQPVDLIRLIDDVLCPTTGAGDDAPEYSALDPINEQCVRRDLVTLVQKDRILLHAQALRPSGEDVDGVPEMLEFRPEQFDVRSMSVRYFPDRWAPWDTQKIIGDIFNAKLNLPCPTLQTISGIVPDTETSSTKAGFKFARTQALSEGKGAKLRPELRTQAAEWERVQQEVRTGQKLHQVYYSVTMVSPKGLGDINERTIKAMYKAAGWDLIDETYLHLPSFLASMPLLLADGLAPDLKRMKRFRTVLSSNVASMAPMQGEYVGGHIPHLMFVGRRGQPQFWSPFQNAAGNHNVAIVGKSGSGKSVLLQDLTASFAGVNAKTIVIDDGRSFEHMAKALGGRFTEFRLSSGISINPFRMIDPDMSESDEDYLVDCMAMLKAIIAQMARFEDRLNDTERGLIDQAVNTVWDRHGRDGTIDAIIETLQSTGHPFGQDLGTALLPFASTGTFGRFFLGDNNLDLSADLTVFELSDLATRPELRGVVLTSIMFVASHTMRKIDRSIPKALLIDEAWQMLKGGAMAEFVETYSRTCRKYGASLITATQSINDYYRSEGSRAALENSDWFVLLQQKAETISDFRKSDRFEMDNFTDALVRSLKRNGTEYSDLLIRGPDTQAVCRLVLDRFSGTLYSSSPNVFARIEDLVHAGYSVADAIELVAFPDRIPANDQLMEAAE